MDRNKVSEINFARARLLRAEVYPSFEAASISGNAIQAFWDSGPRIGEYLGPERLADCGQYINTFTFKEGAVSNIPNRRNSTMKIRGKRTNAIMAVVGILGLLFGFGVAPEILTLERFAAIEGVLMSLGGMAMRAGIKNEANPRGIKKG